jgi:hypothetical protein
MPNFDVLTKGTPEGLPENSINPAEGPPKEPDNEESEINHQQQEGEQ